jgi:hypothetical protein
LGTTVAEHADISDKGQSVQIPKIETAANDAETKIPVSKADGKVSIVDTVKYENLSTDYDYTVNGTLMDKESGEVFEMDVKGFPICKFGDYNMPFYDNRNIQLETGDKILFYTDGLVEAKNKYGEIYGQERMVDFLKKNYKLDSSELNKAIKNNLFNHMGDKRKLMDDATYLIMKVM